MLLFGSWPNTDKSSMTTGQLSWNFTKYSKKVTSHLRWVYYSMFIQTIGEEECDLLLKQSKNNKKSFALAETRTRIARVAGEHSTLRPPVLPVFDIIKRLNFLSFFFLSFSFLLICFFTGTVVTYPVSVSTAPVFWLPQSERSLLCVKCKTHVTAATTNKC